MSETRQNGSSTGKTPYRKTAYALGAIAVLILLLLWMLGMIGGHKTEPGQTPLSAPASKTFRTARVERQTLEEATSWPGTVTARTETRIAANFSARILEVTVRAGDRVKKGDIIARLDAKQLQAIEREAAAGVAAARAEAARARADRHRTQSLFAQEAATRETFEHAEAEARRTQARLEAAEYGLQQARIAQNETRLRAPFDGVIVSRLHEPGDMAMAGDPIAALFSASDLRLEAAMPAACRGRIELGGAVTIRIDTLDATLSGTVDEIVPAADPVTGNIVVRASLPESPGLQPGLFGWLQQACGAHAALLIPSAAVRRIGQIEIVTVIEGERALVRHVRSGRSHDDQVEILSGLDAGETVLMP
ncbi:MAG: efflux RND transporter periplasmic adaptor subunit [Gammaproteobacteria bacterium]